MRRSSGEHVRIIVLTVSAMPFFLFCSEPSRRGLSTNASQANRYMTASTQKLIEHAQKMYQKQIRSDYSTPIPWATAISTVQQWAATGQRCDRLSNQCDRRAVETDRSGKAIRTELEIFNHRVFN